MSLIADFMILGEPASKGNCRRVVKIGNMPRLIKSKKAIEYSKEFEKQCPVLAEPAECHVILTVYVWYRTWRPDIEIELIKDLLQGRIIKNDRQVVAQMAVRMPNDKNEPRVRIKVTEAKGIIEDLQAMAE